MDTAEPLLDPALVAEATDIIANDYNCDGGCKIAEGDTLCTCRVTAMAVMLLGARSLAAQQSAGQAGELGVVLGLAAHDREDEDEREIDRILAMSGDELRAELVADGHDPDQLVRMQKQGLDGILRLAADRQRWREEAGSWRRVAERLETEKQALARNDLRAKLKPCPEEANEALCCFPSCNCAADRLQYGSKPA